MAVFIMGKVFAATGEGGASAVQAVRVVNMFAAWLW